MWRWYWLLIWLPEILSAQAQDSIRERELTLPAVQVVEERPLRIKRWRADSLGWPVPGTHIVQLLAQADGLYIRDYGGQGSLKTVSLRGMAATLTAVTFQGLPLRSPQLGLVDLAPYYLVGLREVSVSPGGQLAISPGAIGEVAFSLRPERHTTRIGWGAGSFGEIHLQALHETPRILLQGVALSADNRYPFKEPIPGQRTAAGYRYMQGAFCGSRGSWSVTSWGMQSLQAVPGPVVVGASVSLPETLQQTQLLHTLAWAKGSYQAHVQHSFQFLRHTDFLGQSAFSRLHSVQAQATFAYPTRWGEIGGRAYVAQDHLWSDRLGIGFIPLAYIGQTELAVWLGATYVWKAFLLRAEGRLSYLSRYPLFPSGLVRMQWKGFSVEIFRGIRFPSLWERYWIGYGNPTLPPERTFQVQLFREGRWRGWEAYMGAFWAQARDRIVTVPLSPVRWQAYSLGYVRSYGAEGRLSWKGKWLHGWVSSTYLVAREYSFTQGSLLPYTPPYLVSFGGGYRRQTWQLLYQGQYVSWRLNSLAGGASSLLRPYLLHDLLFRYLTKAYLLELRIENVTNVSYQVIQGYPMPGRRLVGSIHAYLSRQKEQKNTP